MPPKSQEHLTVESPLVLLYWMFGVVGMLVPPESKYFTLLTLKSWVQVVNLVICKMSLLLHIVLDDAKFEEKMESLQFLISMIHVASKHYNIFLNQQRSFEFFGEIEDMWKESILDAKNVYIFQKAKRKSYLIMRFIVGGCFCVLPLSITMTIIKNIYFKTGGRKLPMETWVPVDSENNYWIAALYQIISFFSPLLSAGVSVSMVQIITAQVTAQMVVLQNMITSHKHGDYENQRKIFKFHQRILRLVRDMNSFFSGQYTLEMAMSSLQIAIRSFTLLSALSRGDAMVITHLLLIYLSLIAPFTICYSGHQIEEEAHKIQVATYSTDWYNERDKGPINSMLIMQIMASKPVNLQYKYVLFFSMEQFTKLMQATYSYLAMIKHFEN